MDQLIDNPLVKIYITSVAVGGIVGFCIGVATSVQLYKTSALPKILKSAPSYTYNKYLDNFLLMGVYIGSPCVASIVGMVTVATFPISIPYCIKVIA